jgi:predicted secreted hydrolase
LVRRLGTLLAAVALLGAAPARFEQAHEPVRLAFPRDHGAHPGFRTEWWYVTGWLDGPGGRRRGFQITFFRVATGLRTGERSAFAPRQILFAHAAVSDSAIGHLVHAERIARAFPGLAGAATSDADVAIDDWRMRRLPDGRFVAHVAGDGLALDLAFRPTQPPLPQGRDGYSAKGPAPGQASLYYSMPQMRIAGTVTLGGHRETVGGVAWLDREWSSTYLMPGAVGWDWTGLNLAGGGALMAFRIRGRDGGTLWAGGTLRTADGRRTVLGPRDVAFTARHLWRSKRTGARYPIDPVLRVRLPGGVRAFPLAPLFPDQELDGRAGGSPVYWEGAVTAPGARGYLELTGYAGPLRL